MRSVGLPMVYLDDFYKAGTDPTLPRHPELDIVDWDHPDSWDRQAALDALERLCREGRAEVPVYDISANGPVGTARRRRGLAGLRRRGDLRPGAGRRAEGARTPARRDRRAARPVEEPRPPRRPDLKDRRKPPGTILRRGMHLYRVEQDVVDRATSRGLPTAGRPRDPRGAGPMPPADHRPRPDRGPAAAGGSAGEPSAHHHVAERHRGVPRLDHLVDDRAGAGRTAGTRTSSR